MISIQNKIISSGQLTKTYSNDKPALEMIKRMSQYREHIQFLNQEHFQFALKLRKAIIIAARNLSASNAEFTTFENAQCNKSYWRLTVQGGFSLKRGVQPASAINDIYKNGRLYGFECATAVVIIFYKAVLDVIGKEIFNLIYQGMYLRDWQTDDDLPIFTRRGNDFVPGDCLYFNNPDFNPRTPQWRGANAIDLGDGMFFAHGVGIKKAEGIVETLNKRRKQGAIQSAYLLSQVTRLDDSYLYRISKSM